VERERETMNMIFIDIENLTTVWRKNLKTQLSSLTT
jgi:hypothetical protein